MANLINDPDVADGRYTYGTGHELPDLLPMKADTTRVRSDVDDTVSQFGVDYLSLPRGATQIEFVGSTSVQLAATMPQGYAWWSNRSDDSIATLTPFKYRLFACVRTLLGIPLHPTRHIFIQNFRSVIPI